MAEYEDDFDYDTDDYQNDGTDLVKKLRRQVSELSKQLREQEQMLNQYYESSREQEIADVLADAGIDPRIAAFIPDEVESMDDLADWLSEYGEIFNISVTDDDGEEHVNDEQYIDPELIQAAELMSNAEEGSIDPALGQDLTSIIQNANSPEELMSILRG